MSFGPELLSRAVETTETKTTPETRDADLSFNPDKRIDATDGVDFDGLKGNIDLESESFDPDKRIDVNNDGRADAVQDALFNPDNRNRENGVSEVKNGDEDINEGEVDSVVQGIAQRLESPESVRELVDGLADSAERLDNLRSAIEMLNDPSSSPLEIMQAKSEIARMKGELFEQATKESLRDAGFDVQDQIGMVKGETGNTIPDIVATNNTDRAISAFGRNVEPGQVLSGECKCGSTSYIRGALEGKIPNQLSGQSGFRTLITTSDINGVSGNLVKEVCQKYDANQVTISLSSADITRNLKEAIA